MLHVPVALITEKLRGQTLEDDLKVPVPREGALQIEGKNVWLSLDAEGNQQVERERTRPGSSPSPPQALGLSFQHSTAIPSGTPAAAHRYAKNKPAHNRPVCDMGQGTSLAPPKKKHCRSLSVPADTAPVGTGSGALGVSTSPQVEGARQSVWRPIPVMTVPGNCGLHDNRSSSGFAPPYHDSHTFSSFTAVNSGSCGGINPLALGATGAGSTSGCMHKGVSAGRYHIHGHRDFRVVSHNHHSSSTCGCPTIPMAPSPLSVDSGRETTSDLQTPPQSPVPRPSSATSVRSHTSCFSGSWLDSSPGRLRSEVLQSRSLSCEEQIAGGCSSGSTHSVTGVGSVPLSPCRSKIPRCHSQPCVLHDRRCGKKRRRDADRPTLDFHKMTETAYAGKPTGSRGTPAQDIQKGRWRSDIDHMYVSELMPIASSPRDTDLPATPQAADHAHLSAINDLDLSDSEIAAYTHLPSTPPASDVSSGIDIREPVKLLGEEEEEELEEEGGGNCGCHRNADDNAELFPLTDLDLEEIESH